MTDFKEDRILDIVGWDFDHKLTTEIVERSDNVFVAVSLKGEDEIVGVLEMDHERAGVLDRLYSYYGGKEGWERRYDGLEVVFGGRCGS
mmetsp:Transcript_11005/g.9742  ORF Transcript_11005/g.9742 Transcript_11005/m.9742 type:complete len:89 (-) Transcript_11005:819-1085(-)